MEELLRYTKEVYLENDPHVLNVPNLERNAWNFEGCKKSVHDLKLLFLNTLFEWINASGLFSFNSLPDLIDRCNSSI